MTPETRLIRRTLAWTLAVAGALVLVALGLLVNAWLINRDDEQLSPLAQTLLREPPATVKPEDNIYLALQGFDAPSGASVLKTGEARVARYNATLDATLRDPTGAGLARLVQTDGQRLAFKGDVGFLDPLNGSVWSEAAQRRTQVERLLADNAELYQRYLALIGLRGYYETARPSEHEPFPVTTGPVRKLFLAAIALHMRSPFAHERELALADLQSDLQAWRTVLSSDGTLLWRMLAIAYLQSDYLLLGDLIADGRVVLPPLEPDVLAPVSPLRDWNIGTAYGAEFRIMAQLLRLSEQLSASGWLPAGERSGALHDWLARAGNRITGHFLKPNATLNLMARQTARRMLAAADPRYLRGSTRPAGTLLLEGESVWSLPLTYNPVGRILAAAAFPVGDNYPLRAWDAAALQRMTRAAYEIRRQRIAAAMVPDFLRQHPEWSLHPADARPLQWNAATAELSVQTVAEQPSGRRFSVRIWQAGDAG